MNLLYSFLLPFGVDVFCFGKKFLVFNLVGRNLKTKYRRSILGFFWTILTPLAMTGVYYFVFKIVLKIGIPNHLVFILSGILYWGFISQTILEGMESIVGSVGLISKVPIPIPVFPLVASITNLVTLLLSTPVLLGVVLLSGTPVSSSLVLLPVFLVLLFVMVYGISLILAVLFVLFRDLRHIMSIFMTIWFYATPVIYDESMIPQKYRFILYLNPFGVFFSNLHSIWVRGDWPSLDGALIMIAWAFFILFTAILLLKSTSKGLVELI